MSLFSKLFAKKPERKYAASMLSGAWEDLGATTAEKPSIKRPINISRTMFPEPRYLDAHDSMIVKIRGLQDNNGGIAEEVVTPEFYMTQAMVVDSVTRFEVIDEFGVDVGIGFVLGQAKR